MVDVYVTNGNFNTYYDNQNADRAALQDQTLLWMTLYAIQLGLYYDLWDEAIDDRDAVLNDQQVVLDYLHETDLAVDHPMMQLKQDVVRLPLPEVDMCGDAVMYASDALKDGAAVDSLAEKLMKSDCCGAPTDINGDALSITEGQLHAVRASAYTGGVLANSAKRRREAFRKNKTALVLRAQSSSRMAIGPILAMYQQAASIYEGLASIYLQGFNSAGAGLGVSLQRLASGNGATTSTGAGAV